MFQTKVFYTYRDFLESREDYDYPRKPTEMKILYANTKEELEDLVIAHNTRIRTDYNLQVAAMKLTYENERNERKRIEEEKINIQNMEYDEQTVKLNFFFRKLRHLVDWYNGTHTFDGKRKV
jgi:hypothetical protein